MSSPSKSEKVKRWLKEYLSEFGEYTGTLEELTSLTGASSYIIKKVLKELEEEGFIKTEVKRGKGLSIKKIGGEEMGTPQERKSTEEKVKESTEKTQKKEKKSLQDTVLTSLLGKDVTVFLISGTRLEGKLLDFDNFTLAMTAPKGKSLVYKHAVATILFDVD